MESGSVGDIIGLLLAVVSFVMSVPAAYDQYRKDPAGFWKTLRLMGLYAVYTAVGMSLLLLTLSGPQPPLKAGIATVYMITWIGYGALWLVRFAPRQERLPAWVEEWGSPLDYVIVAVIALTGLNTLIG
jgi:hypothetical protein